LKEEKKDLGLAAQEVEGGTLAWDDPKVALQVDGHKGRKKNAPTVAERGGLLEKKEGEREGKEASREMYNKTRTPVIHGANRGNCKTSTNKEMGTAKVTSR